MSTPGVGGGGEGEGQRVSRDEYFRRKQLEEARKAGTAPAEVDAEGHEINPHIPQYIAQAPWYYGDSRPGLKHQKAAAPSSSSSSVAALDGSLLVAQNTGVVDVPRRKGVAGPPPKRFRKGACANCGSMTHDAKTCVERPRSRGAKWKPLDMAPDEVVGSGRDFAGALSFEGKRDNWDNYDPAVHVRRQAELFATIERERKARGAEDEDDGVREEGCAPIQRLDTTTRTTVRDLRIREDTAKYLINLDPESAYYDAKTHTMLENPNPAGKEVVEDAFVGDSASRATGDALMFAQRQLHTLKAAEDQDVVGAPSQAEKLFREQQEKKEQMRKRRLQELEERYGLDDAQAKEKPPAQTDAYAEYSEGGEAQVPDATVPADAPAKCSRYEDVATRNGHASVWGSWWHEGKWGYACCHSTIRNSVCTGERSKTLQDTATSPHLPADKPPAE